MDHARAPNGNDLTDADFEAMGQLLNQLDNFDAVLALICDCGYADRLAMSAEATHSWPCPAGIVEYWVTRHRNDMSAWLRSWDDRPLSSEPRW